jgi:hypothetical protein
MIGTKEIKCLICGNPKTVRISDVKRGWGKTCSKSCAATMSNKKTGNYKRYMKTKNRNTGTNLNEFSDPVFSNAHQFSNEEYFRDKD